MKITHPLASGSNLRISLSKRLISIISAASTALLGLSIAIGTSSVLAAEDSASADSNPAELSEVIVTGSRIAAPNEQSTSPIQVLSSQYIETTGKSDISDIINFLPQNFTNSLGQDLGNGTPGLSTPAGVATADLRGLGPNRTLVLVDGRRLGQGSPNTAITSPAPDLDQIPAGLVERVEVVTGGASAAYGADAVAGVINFIMKKNFQGVQVDGNYSGYLHDNGNTGLESQVSAFQNSIPAKGTTFDGRAGSIDVLMGTNFADNAGNITAFFSYRHQTPVLGSQRDYGGCQLGAFPSDAHGTVNGVDCDGSSNSNFFQPLTGPNANTTYSVFGHSLVPRGSVVTTPPAQFNAQPYIDLTREDDRYNAAFLAHEEVTSYFQPYTEFYFMDDRTHTVIAPSALFKDSNPLDTIYGNYPVNCDNPLLSAQQAGILCSPAQLAYVAANPGLPCTFSATGASPNCTDIRIGRRNIEGGGRSADFEHQNYRGVWGIKGDIDEAKSFSYDVYAQYYYTTFFNGNNKFLSFAGITNALQVTGTAANPQCISGGACVPYNIFRDGGVTPAQVSALYLLGTSRGDSTLRTLHADVTGHLGDYGVKSPLAKDGVAFNVGFEHRNDHEAFQPDSAEQSGLLSGFGSASVPIDNTIAVSEEFLEVRAPIAQNLPGINELLFDGGYRHSLYSTSGSTNTYKFEVQYSPIEDYRLRISYDKAIRAPSVVELFNPQVVTTAALGNDPCAPVGAAHAVDTLAQCQRLGVTAAQYGNGGSTDIIPQGTAGQLSQLTGGNPNLTPEQAETYTIGVNFAPSQLPGFSGSIDYWHINLIGEVTSIPFNVIESNCAATGDPLYCSQVVRNKFTGGLTSLSLANGGYIVQTNVNAGATLVSGVDLQLNYHRDLPANLGGLSVEMNGTYLQHSEATPLPGQHTYECAGLYGDICQTVNPRWHHILRNTWMTPWNVSVALTWHYFGKVELDQNQQDPSLHFVSLGTYDAINAVTPAYNYIDLETTWHVNKILTLRAGINNIADKDPPILATPGIAGGGFANTEAPYDIFGRELFASFTAHF